jgi:hypothetical protein
MAQEQRAACVICGKDNDERSEYGLTSGSVLVRFKEGAGAYGNASGNERVWFEARDEL